MGEISECNLCCKKGQGITPQHLLKNLIAEKPEGPYHGGIPHLFTDWSNRLNAKIAVIGQDWGAEEEAILLRKRYEQIIENTSNYSSKIWQEEVRNRFPKESKTDNNIKSFFTESAKKEGLSLPDNFMDSIYFTNAVLCFRRGKISTGQTGIDLKRSYENCCFDRKFLKKQLDIVKPKIVITLGGWALWGLGRTGGWNSLKSIMKSVRNTSSLGNLTTEYDDLSLIVVPVYHPAARIDRQKQIEDYRHIWKSLSDTTGLSNRDIIETCFSR